MPSTILFSESTNLEELGITKDQSSNAQALARQPASPPGTGRGLREGQTRRHAPSQLAIFQPIEKPLSKVQHDYLSGLLHFPHVMPFLGAVDFLETTVRTLDKCVDHLRGRELEAYSGDYAL
jgi:hypothetical protein